MEQPETAEFVAGVIATAGRVPALASTGQTACANCGTILIGPYCSACGQHVADYHRSVWRLVSDFFDNTFCWDNKVLLTLAPLIKQPGLLTAEFMVGRRVRYVHPLRLFLFTSAVCLTLLQFSHKQLFKVVAHHGNAARAAEGFKWVAGDGDTPAASAKPATAGQHTPAPAAGATVDTPRTPANQDSDDSDDEDGPSAGDHAPGTGKEAPPAKDPGTARAPRNELDDEINKAIEAKIAKNGGEAKLNQTITDSVQHRLSWVALVLLPVFALALRAVYWRSDSFYFTHLVFSLHYHTFLLLFWTAYVWASVFASHLPFASSLLGGTLKLGLLLPPFYLFKALRRVYGEGAKRTAMKVIALGSMHLLMILLGLTIFGALAFFTSTK